MFDPLLSSQAKDAMFGRPKYCPTCSGSEFRASHSGVLRRLTAFILLHPFRCKHCEKRVWRFTLSAETQKKAAYHH